MIDPGVTPANPATTGAFSANLTYALRSITRVQSIWNILNLECDCKNSFVNAITDGKLLLINSKQINRSNPNTYKAILICMLMYPDQ